MRSVGGMMPGLQKQTRNGITKGKTTRAEEKHQQHRMPSVLLGRKYTLPLLQAVVMYSGRFQHAC